MHNLLPIYLGPGAVFAIMGMLLFVEEPPIDNLRTEGRAVLGFFCGVIWPLLAFVAVLWVVFSFFRGVGQIFRLVFPRRRR